MDEARKRQRGGAQTAAELRLGLVHDNLEASPGERHRGGEPIRARADHDGPAHAVRARTRSRSNSLTQGRARTPTG